MSGLHGLVTTGRRIDALLVLVGRLAAWLALALMLVILGDVILRRWFVIGSVKLQELEWHLHGGLFLLCMAYAYVRGAHVRIDIFRENWSGRTKAWVELLGCGLFLLPYTIAIIWFGLDFVEMSYRTGEVSASMTGLGARWIIKLVLVAGFALLGLAAIARILYSVAYLFGTDDVRADLDRQDGADTSPLDTPAAG